VGGRFLCVSGGLIGGGWGFSFDDGRTRGVISWKRDLGGRRETYILVRVSVCGLFSRVEGGRRVGVSWASLRGGGTAGVRHDMCGGEGRGR